MRIVILRGDIINLFFEEYCEKELIQPTFYHGSSAFHLPVDQKKPSDPNKVERFELFINTWEMCNAYSELNDPIDQRDVLHSRMLMRQQAMMRHSIQMKIS